MSKFNLKQARFTGERTIDQSALQEMGEGKGQIEGAYWQKVFDAAWQDPKIVDLDSVVAQSMNPQTTPQQILSTAAYEINSITWKAQEIAKSLGTDDPTLVLQYLRESKLEGIALRPGADKGTPEHERRHRAGKTQTPEGVTASLASMINAPNIPQEMKQDMARRWVVQYISNLKNIGYTQQEMPGELAAFQPAMQKEFSSSLAQWLNDPDVIAWIKSLEQPIEPSGSNIA